MARIDVLLRERAGYVARGLHDRVAQVDALLAAAGHHVIDSDDQRVIVTSASPDVETAANAPARRGRPPRSQRQPGD
jgi:hypothetical protein